MAMADDASAAVKAASAAVRPVTGNGTMQAVRHALTFRLSFTQGFLAGQLSVIVIGLLVIRFVIFEDSSRSRARSEETSRRDSSPLPIRRTRNRGQSVLSTKSVLGTSGETTSKLLPGGGRQTQPDVGAIMADIMGKVHYELESHGSESVDWLSIVVAQALAGYRQDILAGGWSAEAAKKTDPRSGQSGHSEATERTARDWMEEILNDRTVGRGMSFLDPIQVTNVSFGDAYPIFSNAKVRPADDLGRMRIELDVDYTDCISLAIETKLLINVPRPRFAVLPISLGLTIERFSGTLAIELFSSSPSSVLPQSHITPAPRSRHELHFSLHPDFALDAHATSLVGSRAKLQDVPKIEQILVGRVRSYIHDRFVWPKYWSLTLPNLVPRDVRSAPTSKPPPDGARGNHPDAQAGKQDGAMDVAGQGNAASEASGIPSRLYGRQSKTDTNPFFETAPPLFPGIMYRDDGSRSSLERDHVINGAPAASPVPGSLPAVEAWRSQAAAHAGTLRNRANGAAQSSKITRDDGHRSVNGLGAPASAL